MGSSGSPLSNGILLLLATSILIVFFGGARSQSPLIYGQCSTWKFVNGSSFHGNLNTVLATLAKLSSLSLYNITSHGSTGVDKVYGMFQCRGDLTTSNCSTCLRQIVSNITQACPSVVGARVQLEHCFLRYENHTFFTPDFSYVWGLLNTVNNSDETFQHNLDTVSKTVMNEAPRHGGFYDDDAGDSSTNRVYGLAQCLGYLSQDDCKKCLSNATGFRSLLGNASGGQIHCATCYYRYESYLFFQQKTLAPTPAPSLSYPPSPAPSHSPGSIITGPSSPATKSPSYPSAPSPSNSPGNIITGPSSPTTKSPSKQGSSSDSKRKTFIVVVPTVAALLSWLLCCL